jgi:hypothetical protein
MEQVLKTSFVYGCGFKFYIDISCLIIMADDSGIAINIARFAARLSALFAHVLVCIFSINF